jgi:predicted Rossmann-fold nucleotide-binding protein
VSCVRSGHYRIYFTADLFIAIGGEYGTLTEIAFALKIRKPVIGLNTGEIPGMTKAANPREVI